MKRVTMVDVAKSAGVSKSTVSQYLNKRFDYMGEETKLRIEQAIEKLGYQPNIVARSLKQKRTSTIGVIVANILHSFSTQVIRAIEDTCRDNDFHVIVCNADDDPVTEEKYIQMLLAKQVDGMIIFPTGGNLNLYHSMVQRNYSVVFVDRIIEGVNIDVFLLDNENASYLAVKHLAEHGHSRIGIVTPSLERKITPRIERINGFKLALNKFGLPLETGYIKSMDVDKLHVGLKEMFSLPVPPTALIASNDLSLYEVVKFAKESGIQIPSQLAVVGIDNVPFATVFEPSLSVFAQPAFEMGNKAAELLLKRIEHSDLVIEPQIHRFQPTLLAGKMPKNDNMLFF
ncbi:LacI family DNA-binding transcriptional regulator [Peribacillus saganii]|uniref:LacI family DNA-binding transcriptional regulator n=1 Tax=Peribacillus saganii TaxID=2303992 RepID=A0A372LR16_9BACI|nr:substrate-binding domain-containing protein [Peribacillus saganii]RFU69452.1 LacI family DNA-binding transcriptional regulator [Peribacillus saganii]